MKIGEFARRYHVAPSKIRYYIHCGILVPDSHNGQYRFNENCIKDMNYAEQLKEMQFSLKEILTLITIRRKFSFLQDQDMESYLKIFHRQQDILKQQLKETYEQEELLQKLADDMNGIISGS